MKMREIFQTNTLLPVSYTHLNGSSGKISLKPSTTFFNPGGPINFTGSVLPEFPIVKSIPGSPDIWSA